MKKTNFHVSGAPMHFVHPQRPAVSGPASLLAEGLARHQAGRLADAERIYNQILATRPNHFDSRHLLGVVFLQRGNHIEALHHIDLALNVEPKNVFALNNRGVALQALKRFDEALASFARAVRLRPDYAEAHSNRANVLKTLGRLDQALASYDRALALQPDYAEAHSNRGDVLRELKRFDEALASCKRAIALRPNYAEAHSNRGNALYELKRYEEALASYDRALALRPDFAEAHSNRGNTLHDLHRFEEALASYDRALKLQPDFAEALGNRGSALQELRRFEEALTSYDRAIALRPDLAETHSNRGNALKELNRFDDALASYDRAVGLRPKLAEAHFNAALCLMLTGNLAEGWKRHEWRWQTDQLTAQRRNFAQPQWTGSEDIAGKTILLHAEQGLGDTLQFCRYVPLLAERAGRVILEVQKPLASLMRTLAGGAQIVGRDDPSPDFDLHCPLLSLPLAFDTQVETIPANTPYLFAAEAKRNAWRDRLGERGRPRIGIVWAGDPRKRLPNAHRIDRQRSIEFDRLAPVLAVPGCEYYSLQKGEQAVAQLRGSPLRHRVIDWTEDFNDFSDTAALIDNLDLIIAVDTSVAHLAGALGKPFWLINRYNTCWRWLLDRDDSPWYPTARLFRQDETRSFEPVIARVAAALLEYVHHASLDPSVRRRHAVGGLPSEEHGAWMGSALFD
jgi:tetratricopeptide (TPR) repeat protein